MPAGYQPTGWTAAVSAEWRKLIAARATAVKVALALVLSVGISALLCLAVGASWDQADAATRQAFNPLALGLSGGMFSGIVFAVLGATAVTTEYSSGMIRATLAATPRRGRVLAAKVLVVGAVVLVVGAVAVVAMFAVGQAVLSGLGAPSVGFGDDGVSRALAVSAILTPLDALLALGLGFALRNAAGAITAELGIMLLPAMLGPLLPAWWQQYVLRVLPASASDALVGLSDTPHALAALPAALVLVAWVVVFLAAGWLRLSRTDA